MIQLIFTLLGIVAVLCIPALWVSWNETIYYGVLLTFFGVVGIIVLLSWLFPEKVLVQIPANPTGGDDTDGDAERAREPGAKPSRHWFGGADGDRNESRD